MMGTKTTTRKTAAKKTAAKKTATNKRKDPREKIPFWDPHYPDISDWRLAAKALRIRPFYKGRNSRPWRCFKATIISMPGSGRANDFEVFPECRIPGFIPDK